MERRQRQKREEGRAERDVSREWAEETGAQRARRRWEGRDAMPLLRKRFQDGVHLLCHGCQRKLKLLLRRWKRCSGGKKRDRKKESFSVEQLRNAISD